MLIAAGVGDEARFRAVWAWTRAHLQRPRSTCWRGGGPTAPSSTRRPPPTPTSSPPVPLRSPASASATASSWPTGGELGAAVLALETATVGSWQVLLAGPWAAQERVVNPSYFAVGLMSRLYDATGDQRWQPVAATARRLLDELTADGPVAGARLGDGRRRRQRGGARGRRRRAARSPRGSRPAGRTCSWPSTAMPAARRSRHGRGRSCAPRWRARSTVRTTSTVPRRRPPPTRSPSLPRLLPRTPPATTRRPTSCSIGRPTSTRRNPTYYGAAWLAIGRLWLDTPDLGGCRRWESLAG